MVLGLFALDTGLLRDAPYTCLTESGRGPSVAAGIHFRIV